MRLIQSIAAAALIAFAAPAAASALPHSTEAGWTATEDAKAKPKRKRSEAQLRNDERLRACGKEWRADKEALTKKGYNWIKFSGECRKRLASQGR